MEVIQVVSSTPTAEDAERIGQQLIEQRLAACVQVVGPIRSIYRWEGKVETANEWLCLVKTRRELFNEVEQAIRSLHPYEVPEILALPIACASGAYVDWLLQATQQ